MKLHKPLIGGRNLQLWKLEHSVQCTVWCTVYSLHFLWRGSCAVCTKAAIWIPGEKLKHKSPTTLHPVVNSEKAHTTQEFTAQCNAKQSSLRIALQNAKDRNHKTWSLLANDSCMYCWTRYTSKHWTFTCETRIAGAPQNLIIRAQSAQWDQ